MTGDANEARLEVARQIASIYAPFEARSIIVTGSAARGIADAYSDLDIIIHYDSVPSERLEPPPLAAIGATRFTNQAGHDGIVEQYFLDGLKVDVGHGVLGEWKKTIEDALASFDTKPATQKVMGGYLEGIPLFGEDVVRPLQERIAGYPPGMGRAMVEQHLFFYPRWVFERMSLERGETLTYYDCAVRTIDNVMCVLAGLNRRYFAGGAEPKHVAHELSRMTQKPNRTLERIETLLTHPGVTSTDAFYALIGELLVLVDAAGISTARARSVLAIEVTPWPRAGG